MANHSSIRMAWMRLIAREERGLNKWEKLVALTLATHMDMNGENAWPSLATLARETGLSTRTVQRAIAGLRDKELIRVKPGHGPGRSNRYQAVLTLDEMASALASYRVDNAPNRPQKTSGATQKTSGVATEVSSRSTPLEEGASRRNGWKPDPTSGRCPGCSIYPDDPNGHAQGCPNIGLPYAS
jgi:DNA-binding transcriptional regulator YhcF (GntR family)